MKRDKQKHQLIVKNRLAIVKSILIEKYSIKKIASDFSFSTSLVYSVLKSIKKDGVNKLLAKTKREHWKTIKELVFMMIHKFIDQTKTQYWVQDVVDYVNQRWKLNLLYHQVLRVMK